MNQTEFVKTWKNFRGLHHYQHHLLKMGIEPKYLDKMFDLDRQYDWLVDDEYKHYKNDMLPEIKKGLSELRKENQEFFTECRIRYIEEKLAEFTPVVEQYDRVNDEWRQKEYTLMERLLLNYKVFDPDKIEKMRDVVKKLTKELEFRKKGYIEKPGAFTPDEMQMAKDYPFTTLYAFDDRGFGLCPYHNEKSPSFSFNSRNNTAHCFGCGVTKDTIAFVMDQQKKTFVEAVKILLGKA